MASSVITPHSDPASNTGAIFVPPSTSMRAVSRTSSVRLTFGASVTMAATLVSSPICDWMSWRSVMTPSYAPASVTMTPLGFSRSNSDRTFPSRCSASTST